MKYPHIKLGLIVAAMAAYGIASVPGLAAGEQAATAPDGATPFTSFSELKNSIVNKISAASQRVWLATDFLSDGDIVSALHLAQYRKVDVRVLLGRAKANSYMSRLGALKNQNIPTMLKPPGFSPTGQSAILSDNQLYFIDGDLDFMTHRRTFVMRSGTKTESEDFATAFQSAVSEGLDASPSPVPTVGRKPKNSNWGKAYVPPTGDSGSAKTEPRQNPGRRASTAKPLPENGDGEPYRYRRGGQGPRPEGIPNKLPKALKWKEIEKTRRNQEVPGEN
ncbi:MAG: hypothetical protein RIQ81_53 [Pseudomonadota bacterium]|jgi:hypothetical protein